MSLTLAGSDSEKVAVGSDTQISLGQRSDRHSMTVTLATSPTATKVIGDNLDVCYAITHAGIVVYLPWPRT